MTALPTAGVFSNPVTTNAIAKQAQDDTLAVIRQMLGGEVESTLTLAGDAVTPTRGLHTIDTEAAAASDDLKNIVTTNLPDGSVLLIRAANPARVVTVKHNAGGAGQVALAQAVDVPLNATTKFLLLKRTGANWEEVGRHGFFATLAEMLAGASDVVFGSVKKVHALVGRALTPGGRLTLTTLTPVLSADVTGAASIFYTPYLHDAAPLYDGTQWRVVQFGELTLTLNNPNHAAATNYDIFLFDDAGTLRIGTGPAWSNSGQGTSARGAGAGTTELEEFEGKDVNKVSITLRNGGTTYGPIAARLCLYLGTCRIDATAGQCSMIFFPAAAAGGTANRLGLWNNYNRVRLRAICRDSTTSWTYNSATIRALNNSNSNRINIIVGKTEEVVTAHLHQRAVIATSADGRAGLAIDSTTTADIMSLLFTSGSAEANLTPSYDYLPAAGAHFISGVEKGSPTNIPTFYGTGTDYQQLDIRYMG